MSKICPITNTKVLYLECLECDDRLKCQGHRSFSDSRFILNNSIKPDTQYEKEIEDGKETEYKG